MTAQQALRYERRRQRELKERQEVRETFTAVLALLLTLAAFALAGTMDAHDEQVYRESWYEMHGVD